MSPLKYENIPRKQSLFNIKKEFFYNVIVPWHVHVEYELVFLNMAAGSKHIGSTFGRIEGKEVLLIGPYLPHNWQNTRVTSSGGVLRIMTIRSAYILTRMPSGRASSTWRLSIL